MWGGGFLSGNARLVNVNLLSFEKERDGHVQAIVSYRKYMTRVIRGRPLNFDFEKEGLALFGNKYSDPFTHKLTPQNVFTGTAIHGYLCQCWMNLKVTCITYIWAKDILPSIYVNVDTKCLCCLFFLEGIEA